MCKIITQIDRSDRSWILRSASDWSLLLLSLLICITITYVFWNLFAYIFAKHYSTSFIILHSRGAVIMFKAPDLVTGLASDRGPKPHRVLGPRIPILYSTHCATQTMTDRLALRTVINYEDDQCPVNCELGILANVKTTCHQWLSYAKY